MDLKRPWQIPGSPERSRQTTTSQSEKVCEMIVEGGNCLRAQGPWADTERGTDPGALFPPKPEVGSRSEGSEN